MITGTYTFKGISIPNAYIKVLTMSGGEQGWTANAAIFANLQSDPLETFTVIVNYRSGFDPVADAEDALLNMPLFSSFERVSPKRLSRLEFLNLFTLTERATIRAASRGQVPGLEAYAAAIEDYLIMVDIAQFIDITRADTMAGVQALETMQLIGAGRANEILGIEE